MMADYITKEQVIEWFRPYGHVDGGIPYYGLVTDIREMKAADVAPVRHGRWIEKTAPAVHKYYECSNCGAHENKHTAIKGRYCWRCGAKMDGAE